jgi:prefoldin subunit 5
MPELSPEEMKEIMLYINGNTAKETINRANKRITELEEQVKAMKEELAKLTKSVNYTNEVLASTYYDWERD